MSARPVTYVPIADLRGHVLQGESSPVKDVVLFDGGAVILMLDGRMTTTTRDPVAVEPNTHDEGGDA